MSDESVMEKLEVEPWRTAMLAAADLLEQRGWIQDEAESVVGLCVSRALYVSGGDYLGACIFRKSLRGYRGSIVEWNDAKGRTAAEVIAKLREVARS